MSKIRNRIPGSLVVCLLSMTGLATAAFSQETPVFTPGNLVVTVEGCGVNAGTCTNVPNGTGNGTGNSSNTGYGDNQAAPLTLFQYAPNGTSSATFVNSLVLPQAGSVANLPVSGEYGSSSEGTVQLSGPGQYLTIMGYGVNANTFNANPTSFGVPGGELAQSGSLTGQSYTPIPRVIATIDAYGNVNSSSANYNVFNGNNPRSTYSVDGINFYISGQGTSGDSTGGVFLTTLGLTNFGPTTITGDDGGGTESQDTRIVQIYGNTLYVSMDSKTGAYNRSYIGTLGDPPATSVFTCTGVGAGCPTSTGTIGPALMAGFGNTGGTGREKLTAAETNGIVASGTYINLSPENYFFASPTVLYVADSGSPKNTSADNETTYSLCGAGGLQKWVNVSGTWTWEYTLYKGLNLVANGNLKSGDTTCSNNTSGTTGLIGLTGKVVGGTAYLYATNYTIADLDPTYLYGISDVVSATTNPGTSFTQLAVAPQDSNFKGVSLAPSLPAGSATITSSPSGLAVSTSGTGCVPGTYITPVTLIWTPGSSCELSVVTPQSGTGTEYNFVQWQDGTTATSDYVTAPSTSAIYTLSFSTSYQLSTSATTGGTVSAGGYFTSGSNATVTATPAAGYYFVNFTGTTTSTSNPLTVTMNGPQSITANFASGVAATLTSPTSGNVLSSTSPTIFDWTTGSGASLYVLRLGTAGPGANDLFDSGGTAALTATAGPFPTNGQTVYATLYSLVNGVWLQSNYTFTEAGAPTPAALTSPTAGSTLSGTTAATFTWAAGTGATGYILRLGTAGTGANDLFDSGDTTALTATAGPFPSNGQTVYATLYSLVNGVWLQSNYTFTESGTPAPAAITSPAAGSTLSGTTATTFTWTAGAGATGYILRLGSAGPGANDLYDSGETTGLTATAGPFPANGQTIYATLYSLIGGTWQQASYTFAEPGTLTPAALTSPVAGNTLSGTSATVFTWSAGTGATFYILRLGTAGPGASDLYDSGETTALNATAGPFPTDGLTVYATLYSLIGGAWQQASYTFTDPGSIVPAALTAPAAGATLSSTVATTFTWSAGIGASNYVLRLGTAGPGADDLFDSGTTTGLTVTAGPFPSNGQTVYATLFSLIDGVWQQESYTFNESGTPTPAALTSPAAGSTLSDTTATPFTWAAGTGATGYILRLGTTGQGSDDLYDSGDITALTATAGPFPSNGQTIYATLYSLIGGTWQQASYTFVESGTP